MARTSTTQPIRILLVEDSASDVLITREALSAARITNELHAVTDGEQALAFLRREGRFQTAPHPDLILLDLNLPRKDGREVLAEIKEDSRLKSIPVVVLTTSQQEQDVLRSYRLHANCYITKPVDFDSFAAIVQAINGFWFNVVTLPPAPSP